MRCQKVLAGFISAMEAGMPIEVGNGAEMGR